MSQNIKHAAAIPNPALQPWSVLVGEWDTVGTHRLLPDTPVHGHTSVEWLEGGAFFIMRSVVEKEGFPSGIIIYGSDDAVGAFFALYFDERGVSRKFEATLRENVWRQWRDAPAFSQRSTGTIADDGNSIHVVWELSEDGSTWMRDMEVTFTRIR